MSDGFPPDEYVIYHEGGGVRVYWQGKGTRVWREGERGRSGAARFASIHAARHELAGTVHRGLLPVVGYEWLPPTVLQLQLLPDEKGLTIP